MLLDEKKPNEEQEEYDIRSMRSRLEDIKLGRVNGVKIRGLSA